MMENGIVRLSHIRRNSPVYFAEKLESTNSCLRQMAQQGAADGTVLIAAEQSSGRGRKGRSFESPCDGLYISFLFIPCCSNEQTLSITPLAAVALCRAIETVTGLRPGIKWPNDLILQGKKICGILTEASKSRSGSLSVILGIGLNVNTPVHAFSEDLRSVAGSLMSVSGRCVDMAMMREEVIRQMDMAYLQWKNDRAYFLDEYRSLCINPGKEALVISEHGSRRARAERINDDFSLRVCYENGETEDISFGEVSIRGLY